MGSHPHPDHFSQLFRQKFDKKDTGKWTMGLLLSCCSSVIKNVSQVKMLAVRCLKKCIVPGESLFAGRIAISRMVGAKVLWFSPLKPRNISELGLFFFKGKKTIVSFKPHTHMAFYFKICCAKKP